MSENQYRCAQMRKVIALLVLAMLFVLSPDTVKAEPSKTVKVGCIDIEYFLVINEDGSASGYAEEYLNKISEYTKWEYEYVKGSWSQCLEWLKDGTIDLLLPAEYTEERAEEFLFSDIYCCMDYAALIALKDSNKYYYDDFEYFTGMTVGAIKGNYLNDVFDEFALKHDFTVKKKFYDSGEEMIQGLDLGEVDAIINGNMNFSDNQKLIAKIDYMPAYFITSKHQPELMEELNRAQREIYLQNPYYVPYLHQKFYGKLEKQVVGFTREEAEFIKGCPEIKVLYSKNDYPFSWYDDESRGTKGVYPDILDMISEKSGLQFKMEGIDEKADSLRMLNENSADMVLNVVADHVCSDKYQFKFTENYYEMPYTVLTRRGTDLWKEKDLTAAMVKRNGIAADWVKSHNKSWSVETYDTWEQCVEALKGGRADIFPVNVLQWQSIPELNSEHELVNVSTASFTLPVCMAVSPQQPDVLVSVLNKSIQKLDSNEIEYSILKNTMALQQKMTLNELMRRYPLHFALLIGSLGVLVVFILALLYINRLRKIQNRLLEEKNNQLEEAGRIEAELKRQTQIDKLTGIYDKITTEKLCSAYLEGKGEGAVVVLDVDNFKYVNDRLGHKEGDALLKKISRLLVSCCRSNDIAGRIGGDEFLLFLKGVKDHQVLKRKLDDFLNKLREEKLGDGLSAACSIGIAIAPEDGDDFQSLYVSADKAMYKAKEAGKNQYAFYDREDCQIGSQ
ncbi:MAG: GGDEF domain-containing protein [Eubacteriales bacterium]|nr:GGDEF domain-containing protein [Eubacteriales bacterium]